MVYSLWELEFIFYCCMKIVNLNYVELVENKKMQAFSYKINTSDVAYA